MTEPERRWKVYRLPYWFLLDVLRAASGDLSLVMQRLVPDLPEDATLLSVLDCPSLHAIKLMIESKTFDHVPGLEMVPEAVVEMTEGAKDEPPEVHRDGRPEAT